MCVCVCVCVWVWVGLCVCVCVCVWILLHRGPLVHMIIVVVVVVVVSGCGVNYFLEFEVVWFWSLFPFTYLAALLEWSCLYPPASRPG